MTYTDLIKALSTDVNCSQTVVKQILENLSDHIAREVRAGVPLRIPALGTFSSSKREERLGRNPATGARRDSGKGDGEVPRRQDTSRQGGTVIQTNKAFGCLHRLERLGCIFVREAGNRLSKTTCITRKKGAKRWRKFC